MTCLYTLDVVPVHILAGYVVMTVFLKNGDIEDKVYIQDILFAIQVN